MTAAKKLSKFIEQYASVVFAQEISIYTDEDEIVLESEKEKKLLSYQFWRNHEVELIEGRYIIKDPVRCIDVLADFPLEVNKSQKETVVRMFRQMCLLFSVEWMLAETNYAVVSEHLSGKSPGSVVDASQSTDYMRIVLCPEEQRIFVEILDAEKEYIGTFLLTNIEE